MYPEIQVLSFISAALSLVPLIWYYRARNIAAAAIGIWLSVTNLTYAIDAVVWAGDADIRASVWCDISTSLITGSYIALPAACLSICVHLGRLARFCQTYTPQAKQRRITLEYSMCFALPLLYIALHLVVQPRRFDLFYGFGCRPATYPAVATIFLVMIPPLVLTVATFACAGIAWRQFLIHGVQFCGKRGSVSSLTRSLYLRLVAMALLEALLSAVVTVVVMWGILSPGLVPMREVPRNWSEIRVRDREAITDMVQTALVTEWSVTVAQSLVYFGLFACRTEVVCNGREMIRAFLRLWMGQRSSGTVERGVSERSSASTLETALPLTEVDLSLVMQSVSTFAPCNLTMDKSLPPTPRPSRRPSVVEDAAEQAARSTIAVDLAQALRPFERPSRISVIASSHHSLESNLDPSRVFMAISPEEWPRPPPLIPARFSRRLFGAGYDAETLGESMGGIDLKAPYPRERVAAHVRPTLYGRKLVTHRPDR